MLFWWVHGTEVDGGSRPRKSGASKLATLKLESLSRHTRKLGRAKQPRRPDTNSHICSDTVDTYLGRQHWIIIPRLRALMSPSPRSDRDAHIRLDPERHSAFRNEHFVIAQGRMARFLDKGRGQVTILTMDHLDLFQEG